MRSYEYEKYWLEKYTVEFIITDDEGVVAPFVAVTVPDSYASHEKKFVKFRVPTRHFVERNDYE